MNSFYQKIFFEVSARSRSIFMPSLKEKMVYIHIPKCGGVSISKALKSCYVNWNIRDPGIYKFSSEDCFKAAQLIDDNCIDLLDLTDVRLRQELLLYGMSNPKVQYISGHCIFSLLAYETFHREYNFVTMLRDPVERWISEYFYNRFKEFEHAKTDLDIKEYLKTDTAIKRGQLYTRSLSGLADVKDYASSDVVSLTKENLHKFRLIGCIEYLDVFVKQFSECFGRELNIGKWNKNPKSKTYQENIVTSTIREQIQEICQSDIEIYNYAVDNFIFNRTKKKTS